MPRGQGARPPAVTEIQTSFLPQFEREEKPRKKVRAVSKRQIYQAKDSGRYSEDLTMVLNGLAHKYYVTTQWPTAAELTRWLFQHGRLVRESINVVAPRISDLVNGGWQHGRDEHGKRVRVRVGGGVCEYLPARTCYVGGNRAHPIRIREAGSLLSAIGYVG